MKIVGFRSASGQKIGIPVEKISGFIELRNNESGSCFIATGPDRTDGEENGWYVAEKYQEVWMMLEAIATPGNIGIPEG